MEPPGWKWAAFAGTYALVWGLINNRVRPCAYRIFDPAQPALLTEKPVNPNAEIAALTNELCRQTVRGECQQA